MLEEAIVLLEYHGDLSRARTILEVVHKIDPLADFSIEAENYIQFIDNKILLIDTKKDDTQ